MISLIVPAHNEEFELPATLAALFAAGTTSGEAFEVIVADDASTDATAAIATAAGARVVPLARRQIAAARNAGARAAQGDIFFFVDADTHIAPVHLREGLAALGEGYAGGGALVDFHGEIPRWAQRLLVLFTAIYFRLFNLGAGAFLFTSRANYEATGGFDERHFAGEEVYFSQALKKLGRFKVLAAPVLTSGRKLRMHSGQRIFWQSLPLIFLGPLVTRSRRGLALWYDGRRETR